MAASLASILCIIENAERVGGGWHGAPHENVANIIKHNVSTKMMNIKQQNAQTGNVDEKWNNIKNSSSERRRSYA